MYFGKDYISFFVITKKDYNAIARNHNVVGIAYLIYMLHIY